MAHHEPGFVGSSNLARQTVAHLTIATTFGVGLTVHSAAVHVIGDLPNQA
jgi:hypothetical protein